MNAVNLIDTRPASTTTFSRLRTPPRNTSATAPAWRLSPSMEITVRSLTGLSNEFQLRRPLPVRTQWEPESNCYAAYDDTFDLYGVGDTEVEAVQHLVEVILEEYLDLVDEEGNLFPALQAKLQRMKEIIHARQS